MGRARIYIVIMQYSWLVLGQLELFIVSQHIFTSSLNFPYESSILKCDYDNVSMNYVSLQDSKFSETIICNCILWSYFIY